MTKQVMFYEEATPISKERHADMSVRTGTDFSFARNVNSVPVTAVEFPLAAAEYAIVFAGTEEAVMPAVVLGAMQDRNSFVDESGHWKAKFVPAFVRRYPFVFAGSDNGDRLTLCIDEAFAGCNREGRGERLFDADGERTQYLNGVLRFQQEFQAHFNATRAFCRKLKDLDLLEPVQARFTTPGGNGHALGGIQAINRQKLKALADDQLAAFVRSDELELAYLHLHSLRNLESVAGSIREQTETVAAGSDEKTADPDPAGAADTKKAKADAKQKKASKTK